MAASSSSSVPGASPHSFPLELSSAPEERGAWGSAGMLNHKETSDFCIVVAGGEAMFHVHSQLLRFHSRFFREMLREDLAWAEKESRVLEKPEVGERAMEGLLRFIYEGRIPLQSHVHEQEVLFLAQELSVDSAVSLLGHHMGSSVTPQTCMSHLTFALENDFESLAQDCMRVLVENSDEALGVGDFCGSGQELGRVSSEAMAAFLQQPEVALSDEYEVWQGLLRWARACCGQLSPSSADWSRDEVEQLHKRVEPLLGFIHFEDIDSQRFTEIFHTKLVPQDILLGWSSSCLVRGEKREPRRQFSRSTVGAARVILEESTVVSTADSRKALRKLLSDSLPIRDCELLFRGSRDGFGTEQFHSKCDNKGPTLVLVRSTQGSVFGGFASHSWFSGGGSWVNAPDSFLFCLERPGGEVPVARTLSFNKEGPTDFAGRAMCAHSRAGPYFGRGDLVLERENTSSSQLGLSYGTQEGVVEGCSLAAEGTNFMVADYEVWAVTLN